jgi:hypothetical protein
MSSDRDASLPAGDAGEPDDAPQPVRAPMSGADREPPTAPLTEAARRAGGQSTWERPRTARPPASESSGAGARDPAGPRDRAGAGDPAGPRDRAGARDPAGPREPAPNRRPATDATSSFDRFVLWTISAVRRVAHAWRGLSATCRLAAYAALGLFIGLFLPWYSQTVVATGSRATASSVSLSGWDAFSLVQTVVLLVSVGVLVLLYHRGHGRTFRVPGGDGGTIMAAGGVTSVLIVWGIFDQPGANGPGQYTTATGIEWGIFIVLVLAAMLTYAGSKIRAAYLAEARTRAAAPPPPARPRPSPADWDDDATQVSSRPPYDQPTPVSARRASVDAPTQVSSRRPPADEEPTRGIGPPVVPEDPPTMRVTRRRRDQGEDGRSTSEK